VLQYRALDFLVTCRDQGRAYEAAESRDAADIRTLQVLTQYAAQTWRTLPPIWLVCFMTFATKLAAQSTAPTAQDASLINLVLDLWQHRNSDLSEEGATEDFATLSRCGWAKPMPHRLAVTCNGP
jgi:hypothetical protein